jgi:hypothetical protein
LFFLRKPGVCTVFKDLEGIVSAQTLPIVIVFALNSLVEPKSESMDCALTIKLAHSDGADQNDAVNAQRYLGRTLWRRWSGFHRRSRVETEMHCLKLMDQSLMARNFDRQVAEIQIRIAVLNRYTALGVPATKPVG